MQGIPSASRIVSEYDQEIPQSQTADKPMAPRGRDTQQSPDTCCCRLCETITFVLVLSNWPTDNLIKSYAT